MIELAQCSTLFFHILFQYDLSLEDTGDLDTIDFESQATRTDKKVTVPKQDKLATKSVVQQGINLKSEVVNQLSQQSATAVTETGLLTEASQEKMVALNKSKKSGVSIFFVLWKNIAFWGKNSNPFKVS